MPSRVRIHFHEAGLDVYDTQAMSELRRLYKAAVKNRYLLAFDLKALPKIRWQLAIKLFEDARRYILDYVGNCSLKVVRERRGLKLQRPKKVKPKKKKAQVARGRIRLPLVPPMRARVNDPIQGGIAGAVQAVEMFRMPDRWRAQQADPAAAPPEPAQQRPWRPNPDLDFIFRE